jgi:hypothetical protein
MNNLIRLALNLALTVAVTGLAVAVIVRVPTLKKIVFGA